MYKASTAYWTLFVGVDFIVGVMNKCVWPGCTAYKTCMVSAPKYWASDVVPHCAKHAELVMNLRRRIEGNVFV